MLLFLLRVAFSAVSYGNCSTTRHRSADQLLLGSVHFTGSSAVWDHLVSPEASNSEYAELETMLQIFLADIVFGSSKTEGEDNQGSSTATPVYKGSLLPRTRDYMKAKYMQLRDVNIADETSDTHMGRIVIHTINVSAAVSATTKSIRFDGDDSGDPQFQLFKQWIVRTRSPGDEAALTTSAIPPHKVTIHGLPGYKSQLNVYFGIRIRPLWHLLLYWPTRYNPYLIDEKLKMSTSGSSDETEATAKRQKLLMDGLYSYYYYHFFMHLKREEEKQRKGEASSQVSTAILPSPEPAYHSGEVHVNRHFYWRRHR